MSDVFTTRFSNPHTAVPDWLPFYSAVSYEARNLAYAIIVMSKGVLPPTKPEIAEALGVDVRTVYRWLNELREAGIMSTRTVGRRNLYAFHEPPKPDTCDQMTVGSDDPCVSDTCDQMTVGSDDPCASHAPHSREPFSQQQNAEKGAFSENAITDPHVGVGGDLSTGNESPTNTRRRPLRTALARWLRHEGMTAAYLFDDPALDEEAYRADFERKRGDGWAIGLIVDAWRAAPLAELEPGQAGAIASADDASCDDQTDELAPDDQADEQHAAFAERVRRELIASANRRPYSYHGGRHG